MRLSEVLSGNFINRERPFRILAVAPTKHLSKKIADAFREPITIDQAATSDTALQMLGLSQYDLVVLHLRLPLFSGMELARRLKKLRPELAVIPLSPREMNIEASELHRLGYPEPLTIPGDEEKLIERCREHYAAEEWYRRIIQLRSELKKRFGFNEILSVTPAMEEVLEKLVRVVHSRVPVLITGASGTGKELVARMIHRTGDRRRRPFVVVNCAAIPEGLLESQFFGYEKGAFTGAEVRSMGKFEMADTGVLFLDEIGEMSPVLQAKILRVLEHGEFERVGGRETIKVDVRLITATNRDLSAMVERGAFRNDLFYRINVFPIELPPLRERGEDIILLAYHALRRAGLRNNRQVRYIDPDALELLKRYPWPGNIRELENAVERALLLSDGIRLTTDDFPEQRDWCRDQDRQAGSPAEPMEPTSRETNLAKTGLHPPVEPVTTAEPTDPEIKPLKELERDAIRRTLRATGGNVALAAHRLAISRTTLHRKIKEYGIESVN